MQGQRLFVIVLESEGRNVSTTPQNFPFSMSKTSEHMLQKV